MGTRLVISRRRLDAERRRGAGPQAILPR